MFLLASPCRAHASKTDICPARPMSLGSGMSIRLSCCSDGTRLSMIVV